MLFLLNVKISKVSKVSKKMETKKEKPKRAKPEGSGRKKGTQNKTTAEIKNFLVDFVFDNKNEFQKIFKTLDSEKKFDVMLSVMLKLSPKDIAGKLSFDDETTKLIKETTDKINEMFN